jgi:hypothetical protein
MSQSIASFQVGDAMPAILAAEASYQESLRQLASWVRADRSRYENMIADTKEHLDAGLEVLELVSSNAGESVQAHNSAFVHTHPETTEARQLKSRLDRFAGTAPHLARQFDLLVMRLTRLHSPLGQTTARSAGAAARMC